MLDLNNEDSMHEFVNQVVVAKVIADEIGSNPSYEKIVDLSDELNISIEEVQAYMKLYQYVSREMIL